MRQTWVYDVERIKALIAKDWNEQNSEETSQVISPEDIEVFFTEERGERRSDIEEIITFEFETFE